MMRLFFVALFWTVTLAMAEISVSGASPLTVREVARELACPCECPLILEDCNMSCGLDWKNQVGELISQGKTKKEIVEFFIATYGEEARLTPLQRIQGKFYQYTRGFGTREWVLLWIGLGVWVMVLFFGVFRVVRRFS